MATFVPQRNVQLAPYTTFGVGGEAAYFSQISSDEELVAAYEWAHTQQLPVVVLGGGSNVLIDDSGIPALVLQIALKGRVVRSVQSGVVEVTYRAGEVFDEVIADTVREGWWGLENCSGIPGTVGATPIQNVGAYGVEVSDLVTTVRVFDTQDGTFRSMSAADCGFGYRDSVFKSGERKQTLVITDVTFSLSSAPNPVLTYKDLAYLDTGDPLTQSSIREAVLSVRSKKFPDWRLYGTAGSFFKNPVVDHFTYTKLQKCFPHLPAHKMADGTYKLALGWILDVACGLRGYRQGGVGTYETQALVIVNYGGASADDITRFATEVASVVKERTGLAIEWEVTRLPYQDQMKSE